MNDPCKIGLRGLIPSLHTPFLENNKLDEKGIKKLIDHVIYNNCSGMLVGAVAGEGITLSTQERKKLFSIVSEHNNNRIPLIVSCSANKQSERIKLSKIAKESGADWSLCQIPEFKSVDQLTSKINEISEEGPENLMIQDLSWDDEGIEISIIKHLFKSVKKFRSLKIEVINSGPKYTNVINETHGKLHVSGGWAINEMIDALDRGVHALMPSTLEEVFQKILLFYNLNRKQKAKSIFKELSPILKFTHQNLPTSIQFAKMLRVKEQIFSTTSTRLPEDIIENFPSIEAKKILKLALELKNKYRL